MEEKKEQKQDTDKNLLVYLDKLKVMKSIHPPIQQIIDKYIRVLEEIRIPLRDDMKNVIKYRQEMKSKLVDEDYGDIYDDVFLNETFTSYDIAQINFNTKKQKEIANLVEFIGILIEGINSIKEKVVTKTVVQKQEGKTEEEKKAFQNKQREDIMRMQNASNKAEHNIIRNNVLKRAESEEEKILTDEISLDIFGKKIGEVEWKIGRKKKVNL